MPDAFVVVVVVVWQLSKKAHTQSEYFSFRSLSEMRSFCGWKGEYGFYFEVNKSAHYSHRVCSGRQSVTIGVWIEAGEVLFIKR